MKRFFGAKPREGIGTTTSHSSSRGEMEGSRTGVAEQRHFWCSLLISGRGPDSAGRAPGLAGRDPDLAGRGLDFAGRGPDLAGRGLELAGR